MNRLVITGGSQRKLGTGSKEHIKHLYKEAIIASIDINGKNERVEVKYNSPVNAIYEDEPSIVFKAGTVYNKKLYVCTNTEILVYSLPDFKVIDYHSHKYFNDVHHINVLDDDYLIVTTGLDMLLRMDKNGKIISEWNVVPKDKPNTWERFQKNIDYRMVPSTKPHNTHPNYTFTYNDDIWVTRFLQKDCICVTDITKRIDIGVGRPHDGKIKNDLAYFTTVNGYVVIVNMKTLRTEKIIDLNKYNDTNKSLGWCRGIEILNEDQILIGFSRIRQTKFRENLLWLKTKINPDEKYNSLNTRICLLDQKKQND